MKIKEIRTLQTGEIESKLDDAREELFKLRFQITTGSLTDTSRLSLLKHNIARMLTVLRERQLAAELQAAVRAEKEN
ncbi:MAG TPA: 50S ribosomal protein L29 [Anaerolineales bacterium]|nr:50S ribosomal protein L29 [Anaerolineales bacterium]